MATATILSGNTTSSAVDLTVFGDIGRERAGGLLIPANWTTATISFLVSNDMGATYQPLETSAGTLYTLTPVAGSYLPLDLGIFGPVTNFQIKSSATQTSTVTISISLVRGDTAGLGGSSSSGTAGGAASTVTIAAGAANIGTVGLATGGLVGVTGTATVAGSVSLVTGTSIGASIMGGTVSAQLLSGTASLGYVIGEGVYNSSPTAVSSGAPVPFLTDSIGRFVSTTSPQFGSGTVATAAAGLTASSALANGLTLKAGPNNTGTVCVGSSTAVSTATGFPLLAGDAVPIAATNASQIYVIGTNATDLYYWSGN